MTAVVLSFIFVLTFIVSLICIPHLVRWETERRIQKFYDGINVGDKFCDPQYMDDPFEEYMKILKVIDKKDGYIKYQKIWENKESGTCKASYRDDIESRSADSFYHKVENYYR